MGQYRSDHGNEAHEKIVKVDGSRRLTLRNRRFLSEFGPGKASWRNHTPGPRRMRHYYETLPLQSQPPPMTIIPPQLTPPENADELPKNTEVSLPDQYEGGADQHQNEEEDQVTKDQ